MKQIPQGAYFGSVKRRVDVSGLMLSESIYATSSALSIPWHAHDEPFVHYLIRGVCEERYGRTTHTCGPSTVRFHPAGEPHANRWKRDGGRVFHIDFSPKRVESLRCLGASLDTPVELCSGMAPSLVQRLYAEYQLGDAACPLALEGLCLEILPEASQALELISTRQLPSPSKQISPDRERASQS